MRVQQPISALHHITRSIYATLLLGMAAICAAAPSTTAEPTWWDTAVHDTNVAYTVHLYFFWTETCPHCQAARPDIELLTEEFAWLQVHSLSLTDQAEHGRRYVEMARSVGERAQSVPAFLFCGRMLTGYDSAAGVGAVLREALQTCHAQLLRGEDPLGNRTPVAVTTRLPRLGAVDLEQWSLPMVTITLGALDSLNPCAFFVLLFLLSLLVHAKSRSRMLLVGSVFVGVSGLVYFLFMTAWLNLFLVVGEIAWITLAAGSLALIMGLTNVKDFFVPGGATLSIPQGAKPGLFKRMRHLVGEQRLGPMLAGTVVLGVLANAYELLCTAGFPMVFTRILTLRELSASSYYGYLALYCVVYVTPLLLIVVAFALTLGQRKLSQDEGRLLKLMSGLMMTGLGMVLVFAPEWLSQLGTTLLLFAVVLTLTAIAWLSTRKAAV